MQPEWKAIYRVGLKLKAGHRVFEACSVKIDGLKVSTHFSLPSAWDKILCYLEISCISKDNSSNSTC